MRWGKKTSTSSDDEAAWLDRINELLFFYCYVLYLVYVISSFTVYHATFISSVLSQEETYFPVHARVSMKKHANTQVFMFWYIHLAEIRHAFNDHSLFSSSLRFSPSLITWLCLHACPTAACHSLALPSLYIVGGFKLLLFRIVYCLPVPVVPDYYCFLWLSLPSQTTYHA